MKHLAHSVDFCVVGGGMAGLCAAVAAARHGAKVALIQDRSVLGGNASSEVRMWIRGAHGKNNLETGLLEEIQLENLQRNPLYNYSIWDSVLYEKARFQENLLCLLNCSCTELKMDGARIHSVKAWQSTCETWHTVEAKYFADCSGDSILAPLCGAEFRIGREARHEFNESIAPETADCKTMGMSCLIQIRETDTPQVFTPPKWANVYATDSELPNRPHDLRPKNNFWWMELGGENDSIHDTEQLKDELLKTAFGIWDHVKNRGDHGAANWALEWVGFLPGKRESRRYLGDHILTQNDVAAEGRFDDIVGYGGWSMDDHHPAGMRHPGQPTIFHPAPTPFGIPYRSLYSRNIENLFFAGRNISATHAALSSTRVMGTCGILGQAVGTAAAIAVRDGLSPRGVSQKRIGELKQMLMDDDCYLPWNKREIPALTQEARLSASAGLPEALRNGIDRPVKDEDNGWSAPVGASVEYRFDGVRSLREARIVFDSDLNRPRVAGMECQYRLKVDPNAVPASLVKDFRIEVQDSADNWRELVQVKGNYQRLVRIPLNVEAKAVRLVPLTTWGAKQAHLFAFDVR